MEKTFSEKKLDGKTQLYLYPNLADDISVASGRADSSQRNIEDVLEQANFKWSKNNFSRLWKGLTKQSVQTLKVHPHCPLFKTAVICRSAARNTKSPKFYFIMAMGENRPTPQKPNSRSPNFLSPKFDKQARDFVQLLSIHFVGYGCFIADFDSNSNFIGMLPGQPIDCERELHQHRELRYADNQRSFSLSYYVSVCNLLSDFLHAGCASIARQMNATSREGGRKVTTTELKSNASELTCKCIVCLLRNLKNEDAPPLLSDNLFGFGHAVDWILCRFRIKETLPFRVRSLLSTFMSQSISLAHEFFSPEARPSQSAPSPPHVSASAFRTRVPWETRCLSMTYASLEHPDYKLEQVNTDKMRGQELWALLEDLRTDIRDRANAVENYRELEWIDGFVEGNEKCFAKVCVKAIINVDAPHSQVEMSMLYLCQLVAGTRSEPEISSYFTAIYCTREYSSVVFLVSSFARDHEWLQSRSAIYFSPVLSLTTFAREYEALQNFYRVPESIGRLIFADEFSNESKDGLSHSSENYHSETKQVWDLYRLNKNQRKTLR